MCNNRNMTGGPSDKTNFIYLYVVLWLYVVKSIVKYRKTRHKVTAWTNAMWLNLLWGHPYAVTIRWIICQNPVRHWQLVRSVNKFHTGVKITTRTDPLPFAASERKPPCTLHPVSEDTSGVPSWLQGGNKIVNPPPPTHTTTPFDSWKPYC